MKSIFLCNEIEDFTDCKNINFTEREKPNAVDYQIIEELWIQVTEEKFFNFFKIGKEYSMEIKEM